MAPTQVLDIVPRGFLDAKIDAADGCRFLCAFFFVWTVIFFTLLVRILALCRSSNNSREYDLESLDGLNSDDDFDYAGSLPPSDISEETYLLSRPEATRYDSELPPSYDSVVGGPIRASGPDSMGYWRIADA